jgi:hypothetical protein
VAIAYEGSERQRTIAASSIVGVAAFLEVAQPPRRNARMPARILARDQQRQLEGVEEAELRELSRHGDGSGDVPALERLLEYPVRTALRGRSSSSPTWAGRPQEFRARTELGKVTDARGLRADRRRTVTDE